MLKTGLKWGAALTALVVGAAFIFGPAAVERSRNKIAGHAPYVISDAARTISYAIDLLGVGHVALGSDYDGATTVAFDISEIAVLTHEMLEADFTEAEIRAVMGGNMLRFLRENLPN